MEVEYSNTSSGWKYLDHLKFVLNNIGLDHFINNEISLNTFKRLFGSFEWASERVSEWLLFNANSANFQLYHGENNLIFNDMMMRSALFYANTLSWIFIVLAHWNNSPLVDMSLHSDTLFWFRANQSLLFLLIAADKQQIPIL